MKRKAGLCLVGFCGLSAAVALAQPSPGGAPQASVVSSPSQKQIATDDPAHSPALTREEALKIIALSRQYVAHPTPPPPPGKTVQPQVRTPDFEMLEAPPPPRTEIKPEAPGPGLVWVPGHYMPVKREWRWVRGEWAVPASPISVWIPARYDEKEKKWAPGYWQPDVPSTAPAEYAQKGDPSIGRSGGSY